MQRFEESDAPREPQFGHPCSKLVLHFVEIQDLCDGL